MPVPPWTCVTASRAISGAVLVIAALGGMIGVDAARGRQRVAHAMPRTVDSDWNWDLPPAVPAPAVPADNPMSRAKFELGRKLFYDRQLSGNGVLACAGCHLQSRAFADNLPRAVGSTGEIHPRSVMSLANVGYAAVLTWANPGETRLEQQALTPMFGTHPVEMGLAGREPQLLARLRADASYVLLFRTSFAAQREPVTVANITRALATFQRGLLSFDSPYDRAHLLKQFGAMSAAAQRGEQLFRSDRANCTQCHTGILLSGSTQSDGQPVPPAVFHNTGLYAVGPRNRYPADNRGLAAITGRDADDGAFKAPSLRNVGVTAPYMHDGSIGTLDAVVEHYARGGRITASGLNAGDGARNPHRSRFVRGFTLSAGERADLVAFLQSLTDSTFLRDPRYGDPAAMSQPR